MMEQMDRWLGPMPTRYPSVDSSDGKFKTRVGVSVASHLLGQKPLNASHSPPSYLGETIMIISAGSLFGALMFYALY